MDNSELRRFYGGNSRALNTISNVLRNAQKIRIATAYFEASGYRSLQDVVSNKQLYLLIGREQGGKDRLVATIGEFADSLGTGAHLTSAMRQMLDALETGRLNVNISDDPEDITSFLDGRYLYQHAKLYIGDEAAAVVTSANMSQHGLIRSFEDGYVVDLADDVRYFVQKFDEYFNRASSITDALIEKLRLWLEAYDPFTIYARALLELYGLPEEEVPPQLYPLASYQRPAVTRVTNSLAEHGGAFFVASTGLGKTVMAAHAVAYLRMQQVIDSVIVICPSGLKENWRRFIRASRTFCAEYSYATLSADDFRSNRELIKLEDELKQASEKTLVILDESHTLRNDEGGERLRNLRIKEIVRNKGAKILLLTATPFSKNIEDVNTQLQLLPSPTQVQFTPLSIPVEVIDWRIENTDELSELPVCFVLTTPTVVKHFGETDNDGERYVLFSENDRRYFPGRLIMRTVEYTNQMDSFLVDLLKSKLLNTTKHRGISHSAKQAPLFELESLTIGSQNPLFESQILHQFCSSPAKVKDFCQKIIEDKYEAEFVRLPELQTFITRQLADIEKLVISHGENKFAALTNTIGNHPGEKIVVFCHYQETARYLVTKLKEVFSDIAVESTSGQNPDQLEHILGRFAPIANEINQEINEARPIQVLIATGALAEGFNLQDAAILVNYDIPWTVLSLAQRMGRILRPWREPREIVIYNFIPSTMKNPHLHTALNWQRRLINYSEQHRSFAEIPVLIGHEVQGTMEMVELARSLQYYSEVDLGLDEIMDFVQNSEQLRTTSFYDDLAMIPVSDAARIRELPPGIRTAKRTRGKKELFMLLKYRKKYYPALFSEQGDLSSANDNPDKIMNKIRCHKNEQRLPFTMYPGDEEFDQWIANSKTSWMNFHKVQEENRVQVMCVMALIPSTS